MRSRLFNLGGKAVIQQLLNLSQPNFVGIWLRYSGDLVLSFIGIQQVKTFVSCLRTWRVYSALYGTLINLEHIAITSRLAARTLKTLLKSYEISF